MTEHTIRTIEQYVIVIDGVTHSTRECVCGWMTIAETPEPTHHIPPLAEREANHLREMEAIEDGTIWREVPAGHSYELFLRRRLSTGAPNQVVVNAVWTGGSQQVLIWPWDVDGLAGAQEWCDQHYAVWAHNRLPVQPNSLATHANAV